VLPSNILRNQKEKSIMKKTSNIATVCLFHALGILHENGAFRALHYIAIRALSSSVTFFHNIAKTARFSERTI
jgi:hypothetical protein